MPRGGIAPFSGTANLPETATRDMGYRSDSVAMSRDRGPLIKRCLMGCPRRGLATLKVRKGAFDALE